MQRMLTVLLEKVHFQKDRMAFVSGPRQVGKTTMALELLTLRGSKDLYRNWDDLEWRRQLSRDPYGFLDRYRPGNPSQKPLAVLDEIHKFPRWKRYLKGLWDTRKGQVDVLVTGSGRLDLYQRGGDSLLGRYHQYRLHPLSLREILDVTPPQKYTPEKVLSGLLEAPTSPDDRTKSICEDLLRWGGFPEPFLRKNENDLRLWQKERRQLLVREDLRDLSRIHLLSHVEEMMELLIPRAGNILSLNNLREDLQVALDSVRLWMKYLIQLYFAYLIRPYSGNIARALRKDPKIYLWDWSEITDEGARFENMVASHLLKWCHFTEDWGFEPLALHFVRDKEKREVDFLILKNKKPWILIEAKLSDPTPPASLHFFAERLKVPHKFLVVSKLDRPGRAGDVIVLDAATFLSRLPV